MTHQARFRRRSSAKFRWVSLLTVLAVAIGGSAVAASEPDDIELTPIVTVDPQTVVGGEVYGEAVDIDSGEALQDADLVSGDPVGDQPGINEHDADGLAYVDADGYDLLDPDYYYAGKVGGLMAMMEPLAPFGSFTFPHFITDGTKTGGMAFPVDDGINASPASGDIRYYQIAGYERPNGDVWTEVAFTLQDGTGTVSFVITLHQTPGTTRVGDLAVHIVQHAGHGQYADIYRWNGTAWANQVRITPSDTGNVRFWLDTPGPQRLVRAAVNLTGVFDLISSPNDCLPSFGTATITTRSTQHYIHDIVDSVGPITLATPAECWVRLNIDKVEILPNGSGQPGPGWNFNISDGRNNFAPTAAVTDADGSISLEFPLSRTDRTVAFSVTETLPGGWTLARVDCDLNGGRFVTFFPISSTFHLPELPNQSTLSCTVRNVAPRLTDVFVASTAQLTHDFTWDVTKSVVETNSQIVAPGGTFPFNYQVEVTAEQSSNFIGYVELWLQNPHNSPLPLGPVTVTVDGVPVPADLLDLPAAIPARQSATITLPNDFLAQFVDTSLTFSQSLEAVVSSYGQVVATRPLAVPAVVTNNLANVTDQFQATFANELFSNAFAAEFGNSVQLDALDPTAFDQLRNNSSSGPGGPGAQAVYQPTSTQRLRWEFTYQAKVGGSMITLGGNPVDFTNLVEVDPVGPGPKVSDTETVTLVSDGAAAGVVTASGFFEQSFDWAIHKVVRHGVGVWDSTAGPIETRPGSDVPFGYQIIVWATEVRSNPVALVSVKVENPQDAVGKFLVGAPHADLEVWVGSVRAQHLNPWDHVFIAPGNYVVLDFIADIPANQINQDQPIVVTLGQSQLWWLQPLAGPHGVLAASSLQPDGPVTDQFAVVTDTFPEFADTFLFTQRALDALAAQHPNANGAGGTWYFVYDAERGADVTYADPTLDFPNVAHLRRPNADAPEEGEVFTYSTAIVSVFTTPQNVVVDAAVNLQPEFLWNIEKERLGAAERVIPPGGFDYVDYAVTVTAQGPSINEQFSGANISVTITNPSTALDMPLGNLTVYLGNQAQPFTAHTLDGAAIATPSSLAPGQSVELRVDPTGFLAAASDDFFAAAIRDLPISVVGVQADVVLLEHHDTVSVTVHPWEGTKAAVTDTFPGFTDHNFAAAFAAKFGAEVLLSAIDPGNFDRLTWNQFETHQPTADNPLRWVFNYTAAVGGVMVNANGIPVEFPNTATVTPEGPQAPVSDTATVTLRADQPLGAAVIDASGVYGTGFQWFIEKEATEFRVADGEWLPMDGAVETGLGLDVEFRYLVTVRAEENPGMAVLTITLNIENLSDVNQRALLAGPGSDFQVWVGTQQAHPVNLTNSLFVDAGGSQIVTFQATVPALDLATAQDITVTLNQSTGDANWWLAPLAEATGQVSVANLTYGQVDLAQVVVTDTFWQTDVPFPLSQRALDMLEANPDPATVVQAYPLIREWEFEYVTPLGGDITLAEGLRIFPNTAHVREFDAEDPDNGTPLVTDTASVTVFVQAPGIESHFSAAVTPGFQWHVDKSVAGAMTRTVDPGATSAFDYSVEVWATPTIASAGAASVTITNPSTVWPMPVGSLSVTVGGFAATVLDTVPTVLAPSGHATLDVEIPAEVLARLEDEGRAPDPWFGSIQVVISGFDSTVQRTTQLVPQLLPALNPQATVQDTFLAPWQGEPFASAFALRYQDVTLNAVAPWTSTVPAASTAERPLRWLFTYTADVGGAMVTDTGDGHDFTNRAIVTPVGPQAPVYDDVTVTLRADVPVTGFVLMEGTYVQDFDWAIDKQVRVPGGQWTAEAGPVETVPGLDVEFEYQLAVTATEVRGEVRATIVVVVYNPQDAVLKMLTGAPAADLQVWVGDCVPFVSAECFAATPTSPLGTVFLAPDSGWAMEFEIELTAEQVAAGMPVLVTHGPAARWWLEPLTGPAGTLSFANVLPGLVSNQFSVVTDDFAEFAIAYPLEDRILYARDLDARVPGDESAAFTARWTFEYDARRGGAVTFDNPVAVFNNTAHVREFGFDDIESGPSRDQASAEVTVFTVPSLVAAAEVSAAFDVDFAWSLTKALVDGYDAVVQAEPYEGAEFGYVLEVSATRDAVSDVTIRIEAQVTNPGNLVDRALPLSSMSVTVGDVSLAAVRWMPPGATEWMPVPDSAEIAAGASALVEFVTALPSAGTELPTGVVPIELVTALRPVIDKSIALDDVVPTETGRFVTVVDDFPEFAVAVEAATGESEVKLDAREFLTAPWTFSYSATRGTELGVGEQQSYRNVAQIVDLDNDTVLTEDDQTVEVWTAREVTFAKYWDITNNGVPLSDEPFADGQWPGGAPWPTDLRADLLAAYLTFDDPDQPAVNSLDVNWFELVEDINRYLPVAFGEELQLPPLCTLDEVRIEVVQDRAALRVLTVPGDVFESGDWLATINPEFGNTTVTVTNVISCQTFLSAFKTVQVPHLPLSPFSAFDGPLEPINWEGSLYQAAFDDDNLALQMLGSSLAGASSYFALVPVEPNTMHVIVSTPVTDAYGAKYVLWDERGDDALPLPADMLDAVGSKACWFTDLLGDVVVGEWPPLNDSVSQGAVAVPLGHKVTCEVVAYTAKLSVRKILEDALGNVINDGPLHHNWTVRITPVPAAGGSLPAGLEAFEFSGRGRNWEVEGYDIPEFIKIRPGQDYLVEILQPGGDLNDFALIAQSVELLDADVQHLSEEASLKQTLSNVLPLGASSGMAFSQVAQANAVAAVAGETSLGSVVVNAEPLEALVVTFVSRAEPAPEPTPTPTPSVDPTPTPTPEVTQVTAQDPLPVTGAEVLTMLVGALVVISFGALLVVTSRRRTNRSRLG